MSPPPPTLPPDAGLWHLVRTELLPHVATVRRDALLAVALLFLTTGSVVASIEGSRAAIEALRIRDSATPPTGLLDHLTRLGVTGPSALFLWSVAFGALAALVTYVGMFARDSAFERIAGELTHTLRTRLFRHVLALSYHRSISWDPGVLLKRLTNDTMQVRPLIIEAGLRRVADVLVVVGTLAYMVTLEVRLASTSAAVLTAYLAVAHWSAGAARGRIQQMDARLERLSALAGDALARLSDIRANGREAYEGERVGDASRLHTLATLAAGRWFLFDRSVTGLLSASGPLLVALVGGVFVLQGTLRLETLIAFTIATDMLYRPVDALSAIPMTIQRVRVSLEKVDEVLREPVEHEWTGPVGAARAPEREGALVELDAVRFTYPGAAQTIGLDGLSFGRGEKVAIVGPSGCGKTTLLRMLFRVHDDYGGTIRFGGQDIRGLRIGDCRARMGLLSQDSFVLADTVGANVRYGARSPEDATDDEVWRALEAAGLSDVVRSLSMGLATPFETAGQNLSGGQRRRLCLARSLVKSPELLLLDEPLTGVAPRERRDILDRLVALRDATIVVVTHEPELLQQMGRVVLLGSRVSNSGRETYIAAIGSHADLLATNHEYRAHLHAKTEPADAAC